MKKLIYYYIVSNVVFVFILSLYLEEKISTGVFIILILIDSFVYRPIIDYLRLRQLDLVEKRDFKKMFGLYRFKFYKALLIGP